MTKCIRRFISQKAIKLSLVLIIFATFSNASLDIKTPKSEKISSLMLVGNSFFYYNNSLHNHLGDLIKNDPNVNSMKRRSITINGSDKEKLDFTYIEDLLQGIELCCRKKEAINQTPKF